MEIATQKVNVIPTSPMWCELKGLILVHLWFLKAFLHEWSYSAWHFWTNFNLEGNYILLTEILLGLLLCTESF